ncbi:Hypothetical predicted protein [Podarcis lilfordi]|uniref:Uncharacterized protein n=1 Tax=Podarcis lilfordi TaxID=74358 RepID=A0AA35JSS4_9SAUR|nr:Hypothetical predicted protein [Podarcis lilfordi]
MDAHVLSKVGMAALRACNFARHALQKGTACARARTAEPLLPLLAFASFLPPSAPPPWPAPYPSRLPPSHPLPPRVIISPTAAAIDINRAGRADSQRSAWCSQQIKGPFSGVMDGPALAVNPHFNTEEVMKAPSISGGRLLARSLLFACSPRSLAARGCCCCFPPPLHPSSTAHPNTLRRHLAKISFCFAAACLIIRRSTPTLPSLARSLLHPPPPFALSGVGEL